MLTRRLCSIAKGCGHSAAWRKAQRRWSRVKAEKAATSVDLVDDLEDEEERHEPLSAFDTLWETEAHSELEELREKYFGRNSEDQSFGRAAAALQKEMEAIGDLTTLPHVVGMQPVVLKVTRINELNQLVQCEGLLLAKWYEPELADNGTPAGVEIPAAHLHVPAFPRMSTAMEQPEVQEPVVIHQRQADDPPGVVFCVWKWRADVEVEFGLENFPFDTQLVNIVFWWGTFGRPSSPDLGRFALPHSCSANTAGATLIRSLQSLSSEWHLYRPRVFAWSLTNKTHAGSALKGQNGRKQGVLLEIPVARRYGYYMNMMRVMGLIASLGFCAFSAPPAHLGERLSAIFALLISLITFKFSVSDKLPKVAYLTRFDLYMHATFMLLGVLAINFALMKLWSEIYTENKLAKLAVKEPGAKEEARGPAAGWWGSFGAGARAWLAENEPVTTERAYIFPAMVGCWVAFNVYMAVTKRSLLYQGRAILGGEIKPLRNYRTSSVLAQRWEQHKSLESQKLAATSGDTAAVPRAGTREAEVLLAMQNKSGAKPSKP
ncbi:hypothetical protein DIPPA_10306 [Diplonema papillatum]|nr:hypothetical protein DIPPA_10306 [Diplonema papillatum]